MNCVIVGGGGFMGSHLCEALLHAQHRVTIFDRSGADNLDLLSHQGARINVGDFLNPPDLERALSGADTVFHLASTTVPKSSNDDLLFDISSNLIGSINILNAARNVGVKRIIFPSSGGTVYGVTQSLPITEKHLTNPISSYGIVKLTIEKYLGLFHALYGLDYCILRISNAYGERQVATGLQGIIPSVIDKALRQQEIRVWGDGSAIRDYIYISDIISAFLGAVSHQGEPRVFNISSGMGYSVNQLLKIIAGILDETLDPVYEPARAYDVPVNILDNSLAKETLHWQPKVSLPDGVRQTVTYMREHLP